MKKTLATLLAILLCLSIAACGNDSKQDEETAPTETTPHTHSYGDWTEDQAPTCTQPGIAIRRCTQCDQQEQKELPASGHQSGEWVSEADGEYLYCQICHQQLDYTAPVERLQDLYRADSAGYYDGRYRSSEGSFYAIFDTTGRVAYRFPSDEELHVYANGHFISQVGDIMYLKKADGTTVFSTEELGATGFGMTYGYTHDIEFLTDGYVFVYQAEEAYDGVSYQIGIIGVDGQWIVPLSDANPILTSGMRLDKEVFIEKMSYAGDGCLILPINTREHQYFHCIYHIGSNDVLYFESGEKDTNMDYMISIAEFRDGVSYGTYQRSVYELHTDGSYAIYDIGGKGITVFEKYGTYVTEDGTVITMISDGWNMVLVNNKAKVIRDFGDDNIDIIAATAVGNGTWLVYIENSEGTLYYSLIDTQGQFLFEPVKTTADAILMSNGTCLDPENGTFKAQGSDLIVLDLDGTLLYEAQNDSVELTINNGVVNEAGVYDDTIDLYTKVIELP